MKEVSTDQVKRAVEVQHGGTATLVQSVPVTETFDDKVVWKCVVHVFDLAGPSGGEPRVCMVIAV